MKLVTFDVSNIEKIGAEIGDNIVDLNLAYTALLKSQNDPKAYEIAALRLPTNMNKLLEGGQPSLDAAKKAVEYAQKESEVKGPHGEVIVHKKRDVKLKVPLRPNKVVAVALNTTAVIENLPVKPEHPMLFWKGGRTVVVADGENIVLAPGSMLPHVEVELAVVMGKTTRMVPAKKALDYIAGYSVTNDISSEDFFRYFPRPGGKTIGESMIGKRVPTEAADLAGLTTWVENKNWDSYCPMGPCIVTSDEIADPHNPPLHYECKVNGEIKQQGTSADLYYKVPQLVEIFSKIMTLEPGDVISTGTVKQQFPQHILQPGDVCEASIKEIGSVKNKCVAFKDIWK